jgi:hypothetical protein
VPSHSDHPKWNPIYCLHLVNPNYNPNLEKINLWEGKHSYEELPFNEEWRDKNIDLILQKEQIKRNGFTQEDKLKISEYNKKWREENKDIQKLKKQEYYQNNIEYFLSKSKKWREENKDKMRDYQFSYKPIKNIKRNERLKNDVLFSLEKSLRNNIYDCFKRNGYTKKSRTYEILG